MQFFINKLDLHHYEIYKLCPIQAKLLGKTHEKKYLGYATINLNGNNIDLYLENKQMNTYSEILGKQTYLYYQNELLARK